MSQPDKLSIGLHCIAVKVQVLQEGIGVQGCGVQFILNTQQFIVHTLVDGTIAQHLNCLPATAKRRSKAPKSTSINGPIGINVAGPASGNPSFWTAITFPDGLTDDINIVLHIPKCP